MSCQSFGCLLGLLGVMSKFYLPLVLESLVHAYLLVVYVIGMLSFFDPIYRGDSIKSYWLRCA